MRRKKSDKKFFSLRESMTDRSITKPKADKTDKAGKADKTEKKVDPLWSNIEEGTQTRQFIRLLLSKNKSQSQRRLMKFNEVRDKLKMEKERSRSHEKSQLHAVKQIESPFKTKTIEKDRHAQETIEELINKKTTKPCIS